MKKIGLILLFLLSCFVGISQQKIIIRGAGAIDTTGRFVYDVFLSNDSLFYSKGGNNVYIGRLTAITNDSLQTVMRRSSVLTENSYIVNNTPNSPSYIVVMDTVGSQYSSNSNSLKFGHDLQWHGKNDSASILNIGNSGFNVSVVGSNPVNIARISVPNSSNDIGIRADFSTQYNEATVPSGTSAPGAFHVRTETGAHYAFPRSKPTLNQILKVTDTTTYPDMQVLSWVDGIDSLKVDSVKVYSSACVDTFKYWVSGTATTIATVDKQNGLNSGGAVTPAATDTTFDVAAAVYKILCERYASAATLVTLNGNSDSSKGRIDVIGVNTSGVVFGLQGTNATNPIAPALSATQLGLATVTFPPLSDSGIVNIYNNFDFNGIDSSAYREVSTTPDSLCFIFTSLLRSDTVCSTRSTLIDSLRRLAGSTTVEARKGGLWVAQYVDSVGSGGGGGTTTSAIDQILRNGNRTRQKIIWDDTSSVAGSGIATDELYPRNYNTSYTNGTQSYFLRGYGYYPNVNLPDTRPNVVWLLGGYNGGFNNPTIAGEHTWGVRAETYYTDMSEFHGILPEFKDRAGVSRRLGSCYVNNGNGYATYVLQIDQFQIKQGATDTTNVAFSSSRAQFGFNTNGSISMRNERSPSRSHSIALLDDGALYNIGGGVTPSVSYHTFTSPIQVNSSATIGTSINATIQADVSVAGKYALSMVQKGLSTSSFGGLRADNINTTGRYNMLYGYNAGIGGIWSHLKTGSGGTASYVLSDASDGLGWLIELTGGTASKSLRFSQSNFADAFQLIGTSGNAKFKYSVAIGASDPVASAALEVTSTTQGFLPPRMTATQAGAISSPAEGLIVYVTNTDGTFTAKGWWGWDGAAWQKLNN